MPTPESYEQFWTALKNGKQPAQFASSMLGRADDPYGVVQSGIPIAVESILEAYSKGYFPWGGQDPIPWCAPDPRMLIEVGKSDGCHVSRTLRRVLRQGRFRVRFDTRFSDVMHACAKTRRPGQEDSTWISGNLFAVFAKLHEMGIAHSVEVYELRSNEGIESEFFCGGLYGLVLGRLFCGESMFSRVANASKIAMYAMTQRLNSLGVLVFDCQAYSSHLESMGATMFSSRTFLREVENLTRPPSPHFNWSDQSHTDNLLGYDPP